MKWQEELKEYLDAQSAKNLSSTTIKQYEFTLTQTLSKINKSSCSITEKDVNAYLNFKDEEIKKKSEFKPQKTQLSSNSKRLILITLRNYLEFFKNYNTAYELKNIKTKISYKEPIQITEQEAKNLITQRLSSSAQLNQRNSLLLELLYESGMRRAEIASLTCAIFKHYDPKDENQVVVITGKGDKQRRILIPTSWIKKYLNFANTYGITLTDPSQPIFMPNNQKTALTPTTITNLVKQIAGSANVVYNKHTISPHKLRSSFATNLNDAGENILKIQQLLGHSNLDATKLYVKVKDEDLKKVKVTKI